MSHRRAVLGLFAAVAALVLSGCSPDSTPGADFAAVVEERDEALSRLDDAETRNEQLAADLNAARSELTDLRERVDVLEEDLRAEQAARAAIEENLERVLLPDEVNAEAERVCALLAADTSGNALTIMDSLISYEARWSVVVSLAELRDRVERCAAIDYLVEIGLGGEFGNTTPIVHKWVEDVRVRVLGSPTAADRDALRDTVADLNDLMDSVRVSLVETDPAELTVHFIPQAQFEEVLPQYAPGSDGFIWSLWDASGALTEGTVLIRSDGTSQELRSHLVREEVTQAFGLANDSFRYQDSIFQQAFTMVGDYAAIDEAIIRMLYHPQVRPGMDEAELRQVLDWRLGD